MAREIKVLGCAYKSTTGSGTYNESMGKKLCVPKFGWDEPLYAVMGGKLRQILFLRIEFDRKNDYSYYLVNVAGVGRVWVKNLWNHIDFSTYRSVEDFRHNNNVSTLLSMGLDEVSYKDALDSALGGEKRFSVMIGSGINIAYQYKWDFSKCAAITQTANIPYVLCYTKENGFFFNEPWILEDGLYATQKDCIEDNEVEVVTFDGEDVYKPSEDVILICGAVYRCKDKKTFIDTLKEVGLIS